MVLQAMGVYLYGEMVLSGCAEARRLAEQCFARNCSEMDATTSATVRAMLYGAEVSVTGAEVSETGSEVSETGAEVSETVAEV